MVFMFLFACIKHVESQWLFFWWWFFGEKEANAHKHIKQDQGLVYSNKLSECLGNECAGWGFFCDLIGCQLPWHFCVCEPFWAWCEFTWPEIKGYLSDLQRWGLAAKVWSGLESQNVAFVSLVPSGCFLNFLKWWYLQKTPKNDHFSRKTHGCWGNPPF